MNKGNYCPKSEILVKQVGALDEDATLKNEWRFPKFYPDFILHDKDATSTGGRNSMCRYAQYAQGLHAYLRSKEEWKIWKDFISVNN